jgi:hypothetical protein
MCSIVRSIAASSLNAATMTVTAGPLALAPRPRGRVELRRPIAREQQREAQEADHDRGMYASMIGTNHAVTGPTASSSSARQGCETHTENATQATVADAANVNRSVGRRPNAGRVRAVNAPNASACARTALTPRSYPASRPRRFAAAGSGEDDRDGRRPRSRPEEQLYLIAS